MKNVIDYGMLLDGYSVVGDCRDTEGVLKKNTDYLISMFDYLSLPESMFHSKYENGCLTVVSEWDRGSAEIRMYLSDMMCRAGVIEYVEKFGKRLVGYDNTIDDAKDILRTAGFRQVDVCDVRHDSNKHLYTHDVTGAYAVVNNSDYTCYVYAVVDAQKCSVAPLCNWEVVIDGINDVIVRCKVGENLCYDLGYLFSVFSARGFKDLEDLFCGV